jgi:hypothetical protein
MLPDIYGLESNPRARMRPMGVTIIATLLGLAGVVVTLSGFARLVAWLTGRLPLPDASRLAVPSLPVIIGFALLLWLLVGLGMLLVCLGLLNLRKWAWVACLILQGLSGSIQVLNALILGLRGGMVAALPLLGSGLVALGIIGYLLRPPIKAAFVRERRGAGTTNA